MGWVVWGGVLPVCALAALFVILRPARHVWDDLRVDQARAQFRLQREWLEARFLSALSRANLIEGHRWEDAHWHDEVVSARDRQTRRLIALIGVHFDPPPFDSLTFPRHATALFEYRKGRWLAEGKRLDETRPDEAFLRHQRYVPVVLPQRRA